MFEHLHNYPSPPERQVLEQMERSLAPDESALNVVRAFAVPVRLDRDLARKILEGPEVKANGNSSAILARILNLPFTYRFADGTFRFTAPARQYFLEHWQNGRREEYKALNLRLADYFREKRLSLPEKNGSERLVRSTLFLAEVYHRLVGAPQRGLFDLGGFVASGWGAASLGEAWAAANILQERKDCLGQILQEGLEALIIPAKYYYLSGNFREAQPPLKQICARFQQEDPARLPANDIQKFIYALAAHLLGNIYLKQRKVGPAIDLLRRSEITGRSIQAWTHVAIALTTLGNAFIQRRQHGDLDEAIKHLNESVRLARMADDEGSLAIALNTLGNAYIQRRQRGDFEEAIKHLDESVRLAWVVDDKAQLASTLNTLGNAYIQRRQRGDFDEAIRHLDESVRLAWVVDDKAQLAMVLNTLGNAYIQRRQPGDFDEAIRHLDESVRLARVVDDKAQLAKILNTLGNAYIQRRQPGDFDEATKHLEESARLAVDDKAQLAKTLNTLGNAYVEGGDYPGAIKPLLIAEAIDPDPNSRAKTITTLGKAYIRADDPHEALKWLAKVPLIITTHNAKMLGPVYNLMGQAYENEKVDDITRAIESYEKGEAINRGPGGNFGFAEDMQRRAEYLKQRQAQKNE